MRIAVSNIAWERPEDEAVAELLGRYALDAIDLVPGKYFADPATATELEIRAVRQWWSSRGIAITGMQALLFGTTGFNLFGPPPSRNAMLQHMGAICRVAAGLDATNLVFGSPRNRDRGQLDEVEAVVVAATFFRELGDVAARCGVCICLEPNPARYGANFMTTSAETARMVELIDHPAIRMQFDTGSLAINGEDPHAVLSDCAALIAHVHASEPDLLPLGEGGTDHGAMAAALMEFLPHKLVSIEMVATKNEPHLQSIERAIKVAVGQYRKAAPGIAT